MLFYYNWDRLINVFKVKTNLSIVPHSFVLRYSTSVFCQAAHQDSLLTTGGWGETITDSRATLSTEAAATRASGENN